VVLVARPSHLVRLVKRSFVCSDPASSAFGSAEQARPRNPLPTQCAVRRELGRVREARGLRSHPQRKSPGRIWRGEFIAGTENARLPRVPQPLLWVGADFKPVFCGAVIFAIACCFLATAREGESQYSDSIKRFNFWGLTCVSYLLAQSSFRLQSEWEVVLASPTGGPNATPLK
jgi:hypothetical protein